MDQVEQGKVNPRGPNMKKMFAATLLLGALLFGCTGAVSRQISTLSTDKRTDVFREVSKGSTVPAGSVELAVKAEIKTHLEDYYLLESKKSPYGKPQYPFLVNIDGQHVVWEMPGIRDDTPVYDSRGQIPPEGGKGMKYTLEKELTLAPGRHRFVVALPGDDYIREIDISLAEDSRNVLEFKPIYAPGGTGHHRNFLRGIKKLEAFLNGREVH